MGIDFLIKTAKPFKRSCQRGFENLKVAYLFDPAVAPTQRSLLAQLDDPTSSAAGKEVIMRLIGSKIVLFFNERKIGDCESPPLPLVEKVRDSVGGLAVGRLEMVHRLSGRADVVIL